MSLLWGKNFGPDVIGESREAFTGGRKSGNEAPEKPELGEQVGLACSPVLSICGKRMTPEGMGTQVFCNEPRNHCGQCRMTMTTIWPQYPLVPSSREPSERLGAVSVHTEQVRPAYDWKAFGWFLFGIFTAALVWADVIIAWNIGKVIAK